MKYIFIVIFYIASKVTSEKCPENPQFLYALSKKCFKLFHGKYGYDKIDKECKKFNGTISFFPSDFESYAFNLLVYDYFKNIKEKYVDRGFQCYSTKICVMNINKNQGVNNAIKFRTKNFPCRGVMELNTRQFYCIDKKLTHEVVFACEKDPPYIRKCPKLDYKRYDDGNCYKVMEKFPVTKLTAKAMCTDDGSTLPIIRNDFESYALKKIINEIKDQVWLDFSCPTTNIKNCQWSSNEITNFNEIGNHNLKYNNSCGYIKLTGEWDTDHCEAQKRVVCQLKIN
uniref:C-type lectin domain-containing protein n=1 Tax=Parastrongyloides trichosuri TaxID=131310 RepID=A0A0N4ZVH7_PARTI